VQVTRPPCHQLKLLHEKRPRNKISDLTSVLETATQRKGREKSGEGKTGERELDENLLLLIRRETLV